VNRLRKPKVEWTGQAHLNVREHVAAIEPEASVLKRVLSALAAAPGVIAWRNNTGAVKKGPRFIRFGLAVGSADVVPIVAPHGRWLAIETKRPKNGETTEKQDEWLGLVRRMGGVAGVARSPEEALELLEQARRAAA